MKQILAILLLLLCSFSQAVSAKQDKESIESHHFTTSDGVKLHYTTSGRGEALVILPGYGCASDHFERTIKTLSQHFKVYCIDYRWHGKSEDPTWGCHIERLAADVHEWLQHLKLRKAHLYAHSMGNTVAWCYFELYGNKPFVSYTLGDEPPCLISDSAWSKEQISSYTGAYGFSHKGVDGVRRSQYKNSRQQMRSQLMYEHLARDWRDMLPRISLPTMIVMGRKSFIYSPELCEWMHQHIKGSRLEIIDGKFGHDVHFEAEFEPMILDFTKKINNKK